jgi:hypothetical protein
VKLTIHLHLVPRSKNEWSYTFTPPICFHGVLLDLKEHRNITFYLLPFTFYLYLYLIFYLYLFFYLTFTFTLHLPYLYPTFTLPFTLSLPFTLPLFYVTFTSILPYCILHLPLPLPLPLPYITFPEFKCVPEFRKSFVNLPRRCHKAIRAVTPLGLYPNAPACAAAINMEPTDRTREEPVQARFFIVDFITSLIIQVGRLEINRAHNC